jgi:hypothetical protein
MKVRYEIINPEDMMDIKRDMLENFEIDIRTDSVEVKEDEVIIRYKYVGIVFVD